MKVMVFLQGYSARDNLLLPAILSAALSALLVLAIMCYALRRRQRCKRRIQEIGVCQIHVKTINHSYFNFSFTDHMFCTILHMNQN